MDKSTPSRNSANLSGVQTPEAVPGPNVTLLIASPATASLNKAQLQTHNLCFNIPFVQGMS
jgi:hypothetical protein